MDISMGGPKLGWEFDLTRYLIRTRIPAVVAICIGIPLTASGMGENFGLLVILLACILMFNMATYRTVRQNREIPRINGIIDVLSPFILAILIPEMFYAALLLSLASATLGALAFGHRLPMMGVGIACVGGIWFVMAHDIAGSETALVIYGISAIRLVGGVNVISKREVRFAEQMREIACRDALTGLGNRLLLSQWLQEMLDVEDQDLPTVSMLVLDLNRFKKVNDLLGHQFGDDLLVIFAQRLQDACGADAFVARTGGDEFTVVLHDHDRSKGIAAAKAVREAMTEPVHIGDVQLEVTASIGIAHTLNDGYTEDQLSRAADLAMYVDKNGKDPSAATSSTPSMTSHVTLAGDIRKAFEAQEFEVTFAPTVSLRDGSVPTMDVAVEWDHPTEGTITGNHLMELGNLTGLSDRIARSSITEALENVATWDRLGHSVNLCFDLQTLNPHERGLAEHFETELERLDLAATSISMLMGAEELNQYATDPQCLHSKLVDLGVRVTLRDVSAAYAANSLTRRIKVSELRVKPEFRAAEGTESKTNTEIRSVIEITNGFNIAPVAVGIETTEDAKLAVSLGCTFGHGEYFATPAPTRTLRFSPFDSSDWLGSASNLSERAGRVPSRSQPSIQEEFPLPSSSSKP